MPIDELLDVLRCPASGQRLTRADGALVSASGEHAYPIVNGVPILIDDASSVFTARGVADGAASASGRRPSRVRSLIRSLIPSPTYSSGSAARYQALERLVRERAGSARPRILVIGGGELGKGLATLATAANLDLIESDVYLGPRVTVVCDGHRLPFADGSFDGVVAQAVLEHVLDPSQVVSEIHRVLEDEGLVYAETPFMQQVHEGAFDFTRFTELGHRRLFRSFEEIERGTVVGPATALVWSLRYFARALPARSHRAALVLDKLVTLMFFWLKYLDRRLVSHPGAADGASGVYFLGRRAAEPVPDAEIVQSYRGTIGTSARDRRLC